MSTPWFEVLVAGAERQFAENGKVQNLSFWAYKILIRARRPEYQTPPLFPRTHSQGNPENFKIGDGYVDFCAWRRYSDLEWFRAHLALENPGVVLPPIPEKDSGAGTSDKVKDLVKSDKGPRETAANNPLIAQRIRRLQLFFNGLMALTELFGSEHLKAFTSMEEAEWMKYKTAVEAKLHPEKGWEKVKGFGFGLFSAVKNITAAKVNVFDEMSGLGKIRKQQLEMAAALRVSSLQISNMVRAAHPFVPPPHQLDGVSLHNAGKPLPHALVYNGHLVASGGKTGTVRHVDETDQAWVDFPDSQSLQQVNINQLGYPNTGVCDPAVVAVHHHLTVMDSYFAYVGKTQLAQDILKLQDAIWYESQYCQSVADSVHDVEEVEKKRLGLTKSIGSEKDAGKRSAMEAEAAELQTKFAQQCTKVSQDYDRVFRPRQRKSLAKILPQIGPLLAGLLSDDEWNNRLAPADASLPLLFDVPEEVIQAQRKAKVSEETRKEPPPVPTGFGASPAASATSAGGFAGGFGAAPAATSAPPQNYGATRQTQQQPQQQAQSPDQQRKHQDPFADADLDNSPYQPPAKQAAPTPASDPVPYQPPVYSPPAQQQEQSHPLAPAPTQQEKAPATYAPPAATSSSENFSMPPPDHDEEPPSPPAAEKDSPTISPRESGPPAPAATETVTDGNPTALPEAGLGGPAKKEEEPEQEWDGEGPPPM